jgi:putative oxidoreductase
MTETAGRQRLIAIWFLRVLLGLAFLTIGVAKLTGSLDTVQTFAAFGWGQWFRYFTGLLDLIGALLVFVPRWTCYGAALLTGTVGLATAARSMAPFFAHVAGRHPGLADTPTSSELRRAAAHGVWRRLSGRVPNPLVPPLPLGWRSADRPREHAA